MVSGFVIKFIPFIKLIPAYDELKRMDKGIDDQVILIKVGIYPWPPNLNMRHTVK